MRGEQGIQKTGGALPDSFKDLEPFAHWAIETEPGRMAARENGSIEELQVFYDAMMRRFAAIVEYLNQFPLDRMPEPAARLLNMALALNEVSLAVERYRQPRVVNGRERDRFFPGR